ncbi:MAG TPA: hypothetical protein VNL92_00270 [Dehalococcoidia bacterium]|nr:hypothetical protein [Dehalococcoidia bacterium]
MPLEYDDLPPLARTYLAVVSLGLPSARLANDESFRIDYVCAACHALWAGQAMRYHLEGDYQPQRGFLDELRATIVDLDNAGVIIAGAGDGHLATMPFLGQDAGKLTPGQIERLDLNAPPKVLDTYLAYKALDELLSHPKAYTFVMEKYGASSEIWQQLTARGYGR